MNSTNEWLQDISNIAQKFQTNDQNQFRALTSAEIDLLVANGNSSSNWSFISIPTDVEDVYFPNIRNCRFEGRILLIGFTSLSLISIGKGVSLCSGLFNSTFTGTCIVGKDCTVRDCQCINNTFIAHQAAIIGCGIISYITNNSHFGNDTLVSVGPSTGGRYVNLHALESFVNLAKRSLEPHQGSYVDLSVERLQYNELLSSLSCTVIGGHAIITRCDEIMNSIIGPCTQISQTKNISDCTFFSSHSHPVVVKRASDLRRVIMLHNTLAGDECRVRDVQMFEHSSISGGALVEVFHLSYGTILTFEYHRNLS